MNPTRSKIPGGSSRGTRADMLFSMAVSMAVLPFMSSIVRWAPFINKYRTILMFPAIVPKCKGVNPSWSCTSVGWFQASNRSTESSHPRYAAQWRGVDPLLSVMKIGIPIPLRYVMTVTWSAWAETCMMPRPCSLVKSVLQPFSMKILVSYRFPLKQAKCRGVNPSLVLWFMNFGSLWPRGVSRSV